MKTKKATPSKVAIKPSWNKEYTMVWREQIDRMQTNISYGEGEANNPALCLPTTHREASVL